MLLFLLPLVLLVVVVVVVVVVVLSSWIHSLNGSEWFSLGEGMGMVNESAKAYLFCECISLRMGTQGFRLAANVGIFYEPPYRNNSQQSTKTWELERWQYQGF